MKIAVYTIALNEEKFVERWYNSAKDADYLLIADTGSTDKTKRIAKKLGIKVVDISIKPWRFDDARNAALALLPDDIDMCISLDIDEVLVDGWREHLEKTTGTQIAYNYVQDWRDIETQVHPKTTFITHKIHARHGYRWNFIIHELPLPERNENHNVEFCKLEIHHKPDIYKDRSSYGTLIEEMLKQNPESDRYQLYYAKTLFEKQEFEKAKIEFEKYCKMPLNETVIYDKAQSEIFLAFLDKDNAEKHLKKSIKIAPERREGYVSLAMYYFKREKWNKCRNACLKALSIEELLYDHNYGEYAWGKLADNMLYASNKNRKLLKWSKNYETDKVILNIESMIAQNFKIFKEEDVL
jgi:glycosyltransferase involved in cell wall biosynthesis